MLFLRPDRRGVHTAAPAVPLPTLEGRFSPEEMDQLTAIAQQPQARNTAREVLDDCKRLTLAEYREEHMGDIKSAEELMELRTALKQKKGFGG